MALIDKLRFHNILTRGGIPEAPSIEFADALQDTFDEQIAPLAPMSDVERAVLQLRAEFDRAVARIEQAVVRIEKDAAEREARQTRQFLTGIAIVLAALALASGLIIAFT